MLTLWEAFAEARIFGWITLFTGGAGGLLALVALLLVRRRPRAALRVGAVATVIGMACAVTGGVGTLLGRVHTDTEVHQEGDELRPVERQRMRREGYMLAQAPARFGVLFSALPLLAGVVAMFAAARRRAVLEAPEPDPDFPIPPRARIAGSVTMAAAGSIAAGFALVALSEPVPGRNLSVDATTRKVLDAMDDVKGDDRAVVLEACGKLEEVIAERDSTLDRHIIPTLPATARRCVEERIQGAVVRSNLVEVSMGLESIAASTFVKNDKDLQKLLEQNLEEVRKMTAAAPAERARVVPQVRMGDVVVTGRLPPEVIQRIVRQNFGRFRLCYESGLRDDPQLAGTVSVRFLIGRGGAVSSVSEGGSDLRDPSVTACVLRAFAGLSFPTPEGGPVSVTYPISFSPPDA